MSSREEQLVSEHPPDGGAAGGPGGSPVALVMVYSRVSLPDYYVRNKSVSH